MAPIPVSTRLRSAIMLDDVLLAKRIIRHNPAFLENPDFDDAANTSLHLAAMLGYVDMIVRRSTEQQLHYPRDHVADR